MRRSTDLAKLVMHELPKRIDRKFTMGRVTDVLDGQAVVDILDEGTRPVDVLSGVSLTVNRQAVLMEINGRLIAIGSIAIPGDLNEVAPHHHGGVGSDSVAIGPSAQAIENRTVAIGAGANATAADDAVIAARFFRIKPHASASGDDSLVVLQSPDGSECLIAVDNLDRLWVGGRPYIADVDVVPNATDTVYSSAGASTRNTTAHNTVAGARYVLLAFFRADGFGTAVVGSLDMQLTVTGTGFTTLTQTSEDKIWESNVDADREWFYGWAITGTGDPINVNGNLVWNSGSTTIKNSTVMSVLIPG